MIEQRKITGQLASFDDLSGIVAASVSFGCVLTDADYGRAIAFRHTLSARGLRWTAGIPSVPRIFRAEVVLVPQRAG
jgi:SRSO17 transposase